MLKWMRLKGYDLADRENWLIAKKEIRDSMLARLLNSKASLRSRTRAAREAEVRRDSKTDPTILNELYGDAADEEWLEQEFVKAERVFPSDEDEPVVAGARTANSETQSGAGMSQFGRRVPRRKTESKSRSRRARGARRSASTESEGDVQISDEEATEEQRKVMAALKRPTLNRKVN
ncbi:hypothetical protein ABIF97_000434 [Bradyrhizobium japonicum]